MTDSNQVPYEARLAALWQQGNRDIAVAFLKRAVAANMTLDQLAKTLQFPQVREHLRDVSLRDVLAVGSAAAQPAAASAAARPPKAPRRRRRGAAALQALKEAVLARLQAAVGPVTTPHLCEVLANGGHDVDILQMNRLLNGLQAEGYVACTGGKPKGWRLKPQGRTAPDPMYIRRAEKAGSQMLMG